MSAKFTCDELKLRRVGQLEKDQNVRGSKKVPRIRIIVLWGMRREPCFGSALYPTTPPPTLRPSGKVGGKQSKVGVMIWLRILCFPVMPIPAAFDAEILVNVTAVLGECLSLIAMSLQQHLSASPTSLELVCGSAATEKQTRTLHY